MVRECSLERKLFHSSYSRVNTNTSSNVGKNHESQRGDDSFKQVSKFTILVNAALYVDQKDSENTLFNYKYPSSELTSRFKRKPLGDLLNSPRRRQENPTAEKLVTLLKAAQSLENQPHNTFKRKRDAEKSVEVSYKGVTKDPSREGCPWKVNAPYRTRDGKLKYFNTYRSTAEEAARVYDDYIRKCYPDRPVNFPMDGEKGVAKKQYVPRNSRQKLIS